ncbi:MAG: hypothetical protein HC850_15255 [Rhodomicrobium sp.]|nr:hypothetical protein [Rhodomicrobium sp.]
MPEVFVSDSETSLIIGRAVRQGATRKIGSRLYTKNLTDPPEQIVRRHLWQLVASLAPGALIADRTALENTPATDGSIFVVSNRKRPIDLPGLTIRPRKGPAALETDKPFIGGLFLSSTPRDQGGFVDLLKARHAILMAARPDKDPGLFKTRSNRAGQTDFVAPDQVEGTLARGFDYCRSLDTPFARAVFMMFLVSEVHPFTDGNGRIARIMINAELVAHGEERILIPTIFRSNYLSALKALSQPANPTPIVRTLDFAQRWVAAIPWRDLPATRAILARCNAFMDPSEADDAGVRLKIPDALAVE